jgi:integrase
VTSTPCDDLAVQPAVKVSAPYRQGDKWRLVLFEGTKRTAKLFDDYQTAMRVKESILAAAKGRSQRTIGQAIEEWMALKERAGCVGRTLRTWRIKLAFLPAELPLVRVTESKAESLYAELAAKTAAATHHASLRFAKALFRWCVKKNYVDEDPFASIAKIGKAKKGKFQLRRDEAKRLSAYLVTLATDGDYRALALLVQVLLGLRSGEVLGLKKRDLDCGGTLVIVEGTKTENARRTMKLQDAPIVQELVARRIAPLTPDALIFVRRNRQTPVCATILHKALRMFCEAAGVPKVCPHSLRGLHATLAVEAGDTCAAVARALGHGSDAVTREHYIAPAALDHARTARVASMLLGSDLSAIVSTLRNLSSAELDSVCSTVGYQRLAA